MRRQREKNLLALIHGLHRFSRQQGGKEVVQYKARINASKWIGISLNQPDVSPIETYFNGEVFTKELRKCGCTIGISGLSANHASSRYFKP